MVSVRNVNRKEMFNTAVFKCGNAVRREFAVKVKEYLKNMDEEGCLHV